MLRNEILPGPISRWTRSRINGEEWWRNFGRFFHERRKEILRSMTVGGTYRSVLDVGSGGKGLLSEIGYDRVAFDIVRGPNLTLIASAEQVPFRADSFDLIYVGEVIEHLGRPFSALSEWIRVLCPGGVLILSTPNGILVKVEGNLPQHKRTFSANEVRTSLERCGMDVTQTRTIYVAFVGKRIFNFIPGFLKMFILRIPIPTPLSYDVIMRSRKPEPASRSNVNRTLHCES